MKVLLHLAVTFDPDSPEDLVGLGQELRERTSPADWAALVALSQSVLERSIRADDLLATQTRLWLRLMSRLLD